MREEENAKYTLYNESFYASAYITDSLNMRRKLIVENLYYNLFLMLCVEFALDQLFFFLLFFFCCYYLLLLLSSVFVYLQLFFPPLFNFK